MTSPLLRWIDAAQHALDHAPTLTVDHIAALVATPDTPGRLQAGVTWWLEEARRVLRDDVADRMPSETAALGAWRARQESRAARVESLLAAHADAIRHAQGFDQQARRLPAPPPTESAAAVYHAAPRRRSAAERALRTRTEPLPTQDAAA
jgi:hypothetical protein